MKKQIIILMSALVLMACSDSDDNSKEENAVVVDVTVSMAVKNIAGEDLLNPETTGAYRADNIKIYNVLNNEPVEVFEGNLDYPRHFFIEQEPNGLYWINVFANKDSSETNTETIIHWNNTDSDTLKCTIERPTPGLTRISKVWYNNELKWDEAEGTRRFFEIEK